MVVLRRLRQNDAILARTLLALAFALITQTSTFIFYHGSSESIFRSSRIVLMRGINHQQWEVRYSNSRSRPYFYNPTTQESLWEAPPSLTVDEVLALPGSEHITNPTPAALAAAGILAKASKSDGSAVGGKVRASHLLVKYDGSRRPSSWKTKVITRNKAEATAMIESYRALLEGEGDLKSAFAKLAETESDCSSARDGGDLGKLKLLLARVECV